MKEYSFANTIVLVNGVEMSGFDEGDDVINIARLTDSASHVVGADGKMTVSLSSDRSGEISFRLNQSSNSNAILSGLINAQENGAFVPVFIQFADTKGIDLASGTQGYMKRQSDMTRGGNSNSQEWIIVVENLTMVVGGS